MAHDLLPALSDKRYNPKGRNAEFVHDGDTVAADNNDCTGTVSLKDAQGTTIANMDLVIANGGKDVALVSYDGGAILNGIAKLQ